MQHQALFGSNEISYDYDASGIKWKKTGGNGTILYYCGNFVYDDNGLSYILMEEGRLLPAAGGFTYEYFLRDHLGNTRVSFIATGDTLMRTQEDSYYPFGMRQGGLSYSNGVENKYLYNPEKLRFFEPLAFRGSSKNNANQRFAVFRDGKELQDDDLGSTKLGWYDFGARFYDAAIARWSVIDPMSEKHYDYTGYAYVFNNPIVLIDMFGLDSVYVLDQANRPADNGTKGTSYTANVYVIQDGEISGVYEGSSFPNSKSNTDNSTSYNTVDEGSYPYNNSKGHTPGSTGITERGLNIDVDNNPDTRTVPGTTPEGEETIMTNVNVHRGTSDKGNYNSRGSHGCITIHPNDAKNFFKNFNWDGTNGVTGTSTGTIFIQRGIIAAKTDMKLQQQYQRQIFPAPMFLAPEGWIK